MNRSVTVARAGTKPRTVARAGAKPRTVAAGVVLGLVLASHAPAQDRDSVTIQSAESAGVKVFYLNIPWGPQTFSAMEHPVEGFYNKRTWPFARLETSKKLSFDGQELAPGNYALVFHPANTKDPGMQLEVRKVAEGEFLQEGNVFGRTPEGTSQFKQQIEFRKVEESVPEMAVVLAPGKDGVTLEIKYGNRRLSKNLKKL